MKKILIAGEYPESEDKRKGGIETVTYNTAAGLSRSSELDVHVLCVRSGLKKRRIRRVGEVTVHEVPGLSLPHSMTMFTWDYIMLSREIGRIKPDVIHAQSQDRYALAAVRSGYPSVMSIHGLFFKQSNLLSGPVPARLVRKTLWNSIEKYNITHAPAVIVMNDYVGSVAAKLAGGKVFFVHNPIDESYFGIAGERKEDFSQSKTVLFTGMISRRKYLEKLLEVASLVHAFDPEIKFRIAGKVREKDYFEELQILIGKMGLQETVRFLGFIPEEALLSEYRKADLFFLTSKEDTSPMAVAQAMAAGLPVVASRIGGIPELVDHGVSGFLHENEDPYGMAESIVEIIRNSGLRKSMGMAAAGKAAGLYREDSVTSKLLEIYESCEKLGKSDAQPNNAAPAGPAGSGVLGKVGVPGKSDNGDDRKRILIIGPVSPPFGGVETVVETLLGSSLAEDYRLFHLSTRKRIVRSAAKGRFGVSNILYGIYHLAGLLYMIAVHSPELVHMPVTSNLPGFFRDSLFIRVCKLAGIPVTGHLHGGAFDKFLRTSKPWRRKFILNSISKLDTLIVLSNYWKNLLEPELKGTRITVVNNAVSPEWLMTGDEREKSGERINILFVGSLGKRKGVFEILRAAALLAGSRRDLHFDLVGTEERLGEKDKLMKLFRELKLDSDMVTFRGALYGEDKMSAYRKADIFILPAFNEAFPIVILEAFGSGLPVITCPVGSIPEVIKNGENGFMVKPGDWRALAEKIELLADEPELRQWMGENNRRALKENYVAERMVEKIDDVYRSILGLEPRIQRKTGSGVGTTRPEVFQSRKQKSREPVAAGAGNIAD